MSNFGFNNTDFVLAVFGRDSLAGAVRVQIMDSISGKIDEVVERQSNDCGIMTILNARR